MTITVTFHITNPNNSLIISRAAVGLRLTSCLKSSERREQKTLCVLVTVTSHPCVNRLSRVRSFGCVLCVGLSSQRVPQVCCLLFKSLSSQDFSFRLCRCDPQVSGCAGIIHPDRFLSSSALCSAGVIQLLGPAAQVHRLLLCVHGSCGRASP